MPQTRSTTSSKDGCSTHHWRSIVQSAHSPRAMMSSIAVGDRAAAFVSTRWRCRMSRSNSTWNDGACRRSKNSVDRSKTQGGDPPGGSITSCWDPDDLVRDFVPEAESNGHRKRLAITGVLQVSQRLVESCRAARMPTLIPNSGSSQRSTVCQLSRMSTIAPRLPMTLSARACPASIALIDEQPVAVAAR